MQTPAWVPAYFGPSYGQVYRGLIDEASDLSAAAAWIAKTLAWDSDDRLLDLACGYGRHLRHLAPLSGRWIGLDLIEPQVQRARGDLPSEVSLLVGDMGHLPLRAESLRAVVMLFNSFGYRPPDEVRGEAPERHLLREIARILTPCGHLLMEIPERDHVHRAVAEHPRRVIERDGLRLTEDWRIENRGTVLQGTSTFEHGGDAETVAFTLRLFSLSDITRMATAAGLRPVQVWGDLRGGPHRGADSEQLVILLEKMT